MNCILELKKRKKKINYKQFLREKSSTGKYLLQAKIKELRMLAHFTRISRQRGLASMVLHEIWAPRKDVKSEKSRRNCGPQVQCCRVNFNSIEMSKDYSRLTESCKLSKLIKCKSRRNKRDWLNKKVKVKEPSRLVSNSKLPIYAHYSLPVWKKAFFRSEAQVQPIGRHVSHSTSFLRLSALASHSLIFWEYLSVFTWSTKP